MVLQKILIIKTKMSGTLELGQVIGTNIKIDQITDNLVPSHSNVSLGSASMPFKDIYVSPDTLHIGEVDLSAEVDEEGNAFFAPRQPIKLKSHESSEKDIILNPDEGLRIGVSKITETGLRIGETSIGSDIYTRIEGIAEEKSRITFEETSTKADFGYLKDYVLTFDGTGDNSLLSIEKGNFELGKTFNRKESLNLQTFILKDIKSPMYNLHDNGATQLFTEVEQNDKRNRKINGNNLSVKLTADSDFQIIPIEKHVNIRDIFPVNNLDLNKFEGQGKFKADFDNVGSQFFSFDGGKFSGLNALKGYCQLSHPDLHKNSRSYTGVVSLQDHESIVDFISYYRFPILFQKQFTGDDLTRFQYYSSSLVDNRKQHRVYKSMTGPNVGEAPFGIEELRNEIGNIILDTYVNTVGETTNFFPAIRVIKYVNLYDARFSPMRDHEYTNPDFQRLLGWDNLSVDAIYSKYTTGTNLGKNWMSELIKLTYAYVKFGIPLKPLNSADRAIVSNAEQTVAKAADKSQYLEVVTNDFETCLRVKDLSIFEGL